MRAHYLNSNSMEESIIFSRSGRESLLSVEMTDPSFEVDPRHAAADSSINHSLHRSWEQMSASPSPCSPSSAATGSENEEMRPLLAKHTMEIEQRRQGEGQAEGEREREREREKKKTGV